MKGVIENLNIGTGKMFALIAVTFPAGSECTCTNGTKTLKAKGVNGKCLIIIPEAGTWTVTATDGTNTKEKAVQITAKGQYEEVVLEYVFSLFTEGVGVADGYTANLGHTGSGGSIGTDKIVWSTNNGIGNQFWISPVVDVTKYSKLCIELMGVSRNAASYSITIGVGVNAPSGAAQPNSWSASTAGIWSTERATYSVDLSNVSGSMYIKLAAYAIAGEIYNIWLEE